MTPANEMRKRSQIADDVAANEQRASVEASIRQEADKGKFSCIFLGNIRAEIARVLESDGYTVKTHDDGQGHIKSTTVSW